MKKNMTDRNTLAECDCLATVNQPRSATTKVVCPVEQLMEDLNLAREQNVGLRVYNDSLRAELKASHGEMASMKEKMLQQQQENNLHMDRLL